MADADFKPQASIPAARHDSSKHEPVDLTFSPFVRFGFAALVTTVLIFFGLHLLMTAFTENFEQTQRSRPGLMAVDQFPEPTLQTTPRTNIKTLRAHEDAVLGSYGWIDADAGIARIPIDRAMTILVERGLPATNTAAPKGSRERTKP